MASFEDDLYLENPTRWQAFKRDCRLLGRLGIYALMWLTRGVLVRRAYRQAQQTGKPLDINTTIPD